MRRHPLARLPAAFFAALALALVLAQTLGALHRVAHADGAGGHGGWEQALFAGDHAGGGCDLYDALSTGDALCADAGVPMAQPVPVAPVRRHAGWQLAAQAAGFLARGPPALG